MDEHISFGNEICFYDAIGNPTCYKGNALTWTNIRHLSSYGNNTFAYGANGTKAATYIYDAWGKVLDVTNYTSANIGDINPIRYRSYYYDTETELYYLESRYYDPETCRFINADTIDYLDPQTIGGLNLYVYCNNNPVNYKQSSVSSGYWD